MCLKNHSVLWGICSLDSYKVPVAFSLFLISFASIKENQWSHHWAPILVFLLPAAFPGGSAYKDVAGDGGDTSCCTWEASCIAPRICVFGEGWLRVWDVTTPLDSWITVRKSHFTVQVSLLLCLSEESLWLVGGFSELAVVHNYLGLHFSK